MTTPSQEFLESWNEYMTECPINEGDLRKPTEIFFRNWLIQILNKLNVETTCYDNMHIETGTRLRSLRMKLLSTVNYFLSIPTCHQRKMDLNYINLINPTFKTVFITLRYLLNYSFFVNMMYSNNIVESAKKIEERDALRSTKNQLRTELESAKIQEENCDKLYRDYEKSIPQQKRTISSLQEKEEFLVKEIQRIEQEIEKTDMMLLELKSQKSTVSENIVSDEEAETIYATKESVKRQLSEQEDFIVAGRQKLKEHSSAVERIRSVTNKMEAIRSEFTFDTSDVKHLRKKLSQQELTLNILKNDIDQITAGIESLIQNIKVKSKNVAKFNRQRDEVEATIGSKDKANLQILKQQVSTLHKLSIKEDELLDEQQRIKDESELIFKISSNILKQMAESFYE